MKSIKTKSLWVVEICTLHNTPVEWSDPIDSAWSTQEKAEARVCFIDHKLLNQDDLYVCVTEYFFGLEQFMPWFVE